MPCGLAHVGLPSLGRFAHSFSLSPCGVAAEVCDSTLPVWSNRINAPGLPANPLPTTVWPLAYAYGPGTTGPPMYVPYAVPSFNVQYASGTEPPSVFVGRLMPLSFSSGNAETSNVYVAAANNAPA